MDTFVIRLWHRVGKIRAITALVLLAGLVGGLVIADRQTQHKASADPVKAADAAAFPTGSVTPSASSAPPSPEQADAQAKAQDAAAAAAAQAKAADDEARRKKEEEASRSNTRTATPTSSAPKYPVPSSCNVYSGNKKTGCAVLLGMGFGLDQMPCLDKLFQKESGWNPHAVNKSSGAYGIPQALPKSKLATAGPDPYNSVETQVKWGIGYIKSRYKTPCGAWSHSQSTGWY
jgi:hypothetical protein